MAGTAAWAEEEVEGQWREQHAQMPGDSIEGRVEEGAGVVARWPRRARRPPGGYADYLVERGTAIEKVGQCRLTPD